MPSARNNGQIGAANTRVISALLLMPSNTALNTANAMTKMAWGLPQAAAVGAGQQPGKSKEKPDRASKKRNDNRVPPFAGQVAANAA